MKKGFTLIELLIVVAIIAILAAIAVPNFLEAQVRSKVSRVKADQRSMATGIEAYFVDNNAYPVCAAPPHLDPTAGQHNINGWQATGTAQTQLDSVESFAVRNTANPIATLTTPVSYVTSMFPDPFWDTKGCTSAYWSTRAGWVLWSPGPDTDQSTFTDLGPTASGQTNTVETMYNLAEAQPNQWIITGCTYDPTNGTVSNGDVYRVKQ